MTLAYLMFVVASAVSAGEQGAVIAERFQQITADARWEKEGEIALTFDAFHPQGMAIVNGEIFVSSVEVVNRAKGEGHGHIFRIDRSGNAAAHAELTDGVRYHPGGIDFDGARLWMPVAEYKADSSSTIYVLDPATLAATPVLRVNDHIGAVAIDPVSARMIGMSWGSRRFLTWQPAVAGASLVTLDVAGSKKPNASHYVDLQDAQWLPGTTLMLCGGLRDYRGPASAFALGGLELIDMTSLAPVHQVPVSLWEPGGRPMTQNAFAVEATESGLRFYFLPADGRATIYMYVPQLDKK